VITVWPSEFDKWASKPIDVLPLRKGSTTQRARELNHKLELARALNRKFAAIINYEAVWRDDLAKIILSRNWDMVVADEAHRMKQPGGRMSRFMAKLSPKAKRRVGLTGTPMPHSPMDIYAQYRFLDPGIFGTSFVRFRNRYAIMGGYGGHEILEYQNMDELNAKFYSIAHRVSKNDVLDLPEVVHEMRSVELGPEAKRLYYELEHEFIADVGEGKITAVNVLARLLRLQQITSGFGVTEDKKILDVDNAKHAALIDLLEDLPLTEPVVVFCRFRHDLDRVHLAAKERGRMSYEISGRIKQLQEWTESDTGDVLAVQIQAGGLGIDLTRAAYCIYYSLGFSLGDYEQSLARLHRQGQTRSVTSISLIAKGTIDKRIYSALEKRKNVIDAILETIKQNQFSQK